MTVTPAAAPRPLRADARRNYDRLVSAAAAAIAELGPDVPLDDVARRAGVGIGTLYRHFPTRLALLEAVFRDSIDALSDQADDLLDAPSPRDALVTWLHAVLVHNMTQRGLKEAMMNDSGAGLIPAIKAHMYEAGAALLARARQAGGVRPDLEITDLLRLIHSIALASDQTPGGAERAERLFALTMDGLRGPDPAAP